LIFSPTADIGESQSISMAHFGFSGNEWRMPNGFSPLESDCCYDSGLQTSYDSGLGLHYESHSLSSDVRPNASDVVYTSNNSSSAESEREILEQDFNRLNLTYEEQVANVSGQGRSITQTRSSIVCPVADHFTPSQLSEFFKQDEDGDTQLHLAIIKPNVEAALWLISSASLPDWLDIQNNKYFHTPLHLAVITNQPVIVRSLLLHGACTSRRDHQGNTPLHIVCARGMLECLQQLATPLSVQEREALHGRREQCGVVAHIPALDMTIKNYEGQTCLHLAQESSSAQRLEVLQYLILQCGVDVNMQEGKCGYTLLHQAIKSNDVEVIKFLLSQRLQRLDINMPCYNNSNALNIANSLRLGEVARWLMLCGAVEQCDSSDGKESDSDDEVMDRFDDLVISGQNRNLHYS